MLLGADDGSDVGPVGTLGRERVAGLDLSAPVLEACEHARRQVLVDERPRRRRADLACNTHRGE